MVQVDIFWSYAIGAGFSLAAWRQIKKIKESRSTADADTNTKRKYPSPFENLYFVKTLLYVAALFAPSGIYLLWAFPSWETMHVGTYETIPAWIVALFAISNVTQGILGYWVTYKLYTAQRYYLAFLQPVIGYFLMFFILVNGWDKTGYMRFFSATREDFLNWDISTGIAWLTSDVAITLYAMGVVLIPVMLYYLVTWIKEGYAMDDNVDQERAQKTGVIKILALVLSMVFIGSLGFAIVAALLIINLDWILGIIIFAAVFYVFGLSRWGIFRILYENLILMDKSNVAESSAPGVSTG